VKKGIARWLLDIGALLREPAFALCPLLVAVFLSAAYFVVPANESLAAENDLKLQDLVEEALKNSPEIQMFDARTAAARFRVPQAKSLPDPMFMFGYQNEGFKKYTYGEMPDAQWMFSASQMFLFPGKLGLKGEMAAKEADGAGASYESAKRRVVAKIKEQYFDLFLTYKGIDFLQDMKALFMRVEDAATARYSSGMGMQQEVLMAQTEKYMLLEREEMFRQKQRSTSAMLNTTVGRDSGAPMGRPAETGAILFGLTSDELVSAAIDASPEISVKKSMIGAAEAKVRMAEKEYYPDMTLNAGYFARGGQFDDMWSLTTTLNIPLYYRTKQRQAVHEAQALLTEARNDLEAAKLMIASAIRDNMSMVTASERLMDLYRNGLIPKTYQDFESALSGYTNGRIEALTVITRLKNIIEFELLYWTQFTEREKALARIEAISGINLQAAGRKDQ